MTATRSWGRSHPLRPLMAPLCVNQLGGVGS